MALTIRQTCSLAITSRQLISGRYRLRGHTKTVNRYARTLGWSMPRTQPGAPFERYGTTIAALDGLAMIRIRLRRLTADVSSCTQTSSDRRELKCTRAGRTAIAHLCCTLLSFAALVQTQRIRPLNDARSAERSSTDRALRHAQVIVGD